MEQDNLARPETPSEIDMARMMVSIIEQAWQLPRIWFTCCRNAVTEGWWPAVHHDP